MSNRRILIPRKRLRYLYSQRRLSSTEIAHLYECHSVTVRNRLKEYGIHIRDQTECRQRFARRDFSGDSTEKAYLVGFRLGDLNVYKTVAHSRTIVVRTRTTKREQIKLMKRIFGPYGSVRLYPNSKTGTTQVNCYLNNSFEFLLDSKKRVPAWVVGKNNGVAFIAGYVDAEGSFKINQGRGRFQLVSYDVRILRWTCSFLLERGIRVKLNRIAKKGEFKFDLWRVDINEMGSLLKFSNLVEPFLVHDKRKKDLLKVKDNIVRRIKSR